jgi:hypothetical protein
VPNEQSKDELSRVVTAMQKWPAIPETYYFQAGGPTNTFPDLSKFAASTLESSDALQPGRLAMILRGSSWHEIILASVSGTDNSQWLCSTTKHDGKQIWVAVKFVQGSYLVAADLSRERTYEAIVFPNYIRAGEDVWSPTPDDMEAFFAEAKTVASQLGVIPPEVYCVSGGLQNCIPGIEDIVEERKRGCVQPSPGKFVLIYDEGTFIWHEALLCVANPDATQWLCLTTDSDDTASETFWTALTLVKVVIVCLRILVAIASIPHT